MDLLWYNSVEPRWSSREQMTFQTVTCPLSFWKWSTWGLVSCMKVVPCISEAPKYPLQCKRRQLLIDFANIYTPQFWFIFFSFLGAFITTEHLLKLLFAYICMCRYLQNRWIILITSGIGGLYENLSTQFSFHLHWTVYWPLRIVCCTACNFTVGNLATTGCSLTLWSRRSSK